MLKAYKYRIYPTIDQEVFIAKHFGCVRLLYNVGLLYRQYAWQGGVSIGYFESKRELPELKKEYPFLKEVNSQSLQKSLKDLDTAYSNFFKKKSGYPNFKSKYGRQSFHCPQSVTIFLSKGLLFLPKFKEPIKVVVHRKFKGTIRSCTVSKTQTGKYFASILVENNIELPIKKPITDETAIGDDLGIKDFIVSSNGEKTNNPTYLKEALGKIKYLNKQLSKKKKGSKRRNKARLKLAKEHEKIANQRKDFLHKESNEKTNHFDTVCMEELKVRNMVKNRKLARAINDAGWGMYKEFVKYKCEFKGKNFLQCGTFDPSSKTCHCCDFVNHDLKLSDREWTCPSCKTVLDRDENASINIKRFALRKWRVERSLQDTEVSPLPKPKGKGKRAVEVLKIRKSVLLIAS